MTQEQQRAILEQVRAAQDPRTAPGLASAPVWLRCPTAADYLRFACSRSGAAGQDGRKALTGSAQLSRAPRLRLLPVWTCGHWQMTCLTVLAS